MSTKNVNGKYTNKIYVMFCCFNAWIQYEHTVTSCKLCNSFLGTKLHFGSLFHLDKHLYHVDLAQPQNVRTADAYV